MPIKELLPAGEENAITRKQLRALTGLSDRQVRLQIATEAALAHWPDDEDGDFQ